MNKDLVIIILGRVLQTVIMLASIRLLTTYLSPKEVGNYYSILSILTFFNLVLLNPPGMYFSRNLLKWKISGDLFNVLSVFIIWMLFVSILSVPISIYFYNVLEYNQRFDLNLFLIYMFFAIFISTIHRNVLYGTNTLGFRKEFVYYLLITLITGLLFSIYIVLYHNDSALGWLIGIVISEFLILPIIFNFFLQKNRLDFRKIRTFFSKKRIKILLSFTIPIGVTTFLMWGQIAAYRFIIDYKYSVEVLAYIAVGISVSSAVFTSIESISMQYFNPIFLKKILNATKKERTIAWNNIAKQVVPIYILTVFFTISMAEVLINILVDNKFHDSYIYTMIGVGIDFFRVMSNLLNNVAQSEYKTKSTVKPYLVGFIVSLGLLSSMDFNTNYSMIPIVLVTAYFLVYVYMYTIMKKILDIKYDIEIVKIIFLSLPFSSIYFIDIPMTDIVFNLAVLFIFGVYFLFVLWLLHKNHLKGNR